ncbi:MAG: hypothetical protein MRERV_19c020 [Mycoplasmataceae bacterium RV_VA103A]|nr:MAG: hypothetical protein MRERV_19c020 [Mycoplasmataceae bacterium RV_VA103A]
MRRGEVENNLYRCDKCWGKVYFDKSITNAQEADDQAWADICKHEDEECDKPKNERTIAVYYSPNNGGDEHADKNKYGKNKTGKRNRRERVKGEKLEQNPIKSQTVKKLTEPLELSEGALWVECWWLG